jgi:hypothetical protein
MAETFFYVLWEDPPVYVVTSGDTLQAGLSLVLGHAQGRPCHVLARQTWHVPLLVPSLARADRWLKTQRPHVRLVTMVATQADVEHLYRVGVEAIEAHNLAFVDEKLFYPEPGTPKVYDAVHNARTARFKRHELALGVPNLAWITYEVGVGEPSIAEIAGRYRDLKYVNYAEPGGHYWIGQDEIRRITNQSHCGLVLSELEGPNNASMEYFLCGAPLVTTPAVGGREAMYDPRHVAIVEPTPSAVEAAVAAFVGHAPDPEEIRRSALAKARPHRARLIAWLSGVVGRDLMSEADDSLWLPQFCDKLREVWALDDLDDGRQVGRRVYAPRRPRS